MNEELKQEDDADAPDVADGEVATEEVVEESADDQALVEAAEAEPGEEAPQDDEPAGDASEDATEPDTDGLMAPDEAPLDAPAGTDEEGDAIPDEGVEPTSEHPKSEEDADAPVEVQPAVMPAPVVDTPPALAIAAAPAKVRYTGAATVRLVEAYRWDAKNKFTCLVAEPDLVALLLEDGEFEVIEA